jgi:hypothetical protein
MNDIIVAIGCVVVALAVFGGYCLCRISSDEF